MIDFNKLSKSTRRFFVADLWNYRKTFWGHWKVTRDFDDCAVVDLLPKVALVPMQENKKNNEKVERMVFTVNHLFVSISNQLFTMY